jgi:hypothetical protein
MRVADGESMGFSKWEGWIRRGAGMGTGRGEGFHPCNRYERRDRSL